MRYSIYLPINAKDLTIHLMMFAYANWLKPIKFTRANNSDLLRALKYLIEARLYLNLCFDLHSAIIFIESLQIDLFNI